MIVKRNKVIQKKIQIKNKVDNLVTLFLKHLTHEDLLHQNHLRHLVKTQNPGRTSDLLNQNLGGKP